MFAVGVLEIYSFTLSWYELLSCSLRQLERPTDEANALTKCKSSEGEKLGTIIVTYIRKIYLQ